MNTKFQIRFSSIWIIALVMLHLQFISNDTVASENNKKERIVIDTASFYVVTGKVVNELTNEPIVFANVFLLNNNMGTVTNTDGEFLLKIPKSLENPKFGVAHIGFKNTELPVMENLANEVKVTLLPMSVNMQEVKIRTNDPIKLIREARAKVPENYAVDPAMATGFYREWILQNRHYVSVAEAILDVYKGSYTSENDIDRVKLYKGRKSTDVKRMDTVIFKLQGGPYTAFLLDIVKNPDLLLAEENLAYYTYKLEGIVKLNDINCYSISFEQNENIMYPLYSGKIYLEMENLAIAGLEFGLSQIGLKNAGSMLVQKKPIGMKVEPVNGNYYVNYRQVNDKWRINYVRSEVKFKCKWNKKLFATDFTIMAEMAVTNWDMDHIVKFKLSEITKRNDFLSDDVSYFEDANFWGEHNTIKPEESIESAIRKINKKVER